MSSKGTNMRRTAQPDQPISWNLHTTALRITTAATIRQTACDKGWRVRPTSIAVFVRLATIERRMPALKIDATNQKTSSSLPIRLDISRPQSYGSYKRFAIPFRSPRVTLTFLILGRNCSTVQVHPTGHPQWFGLLDMRFPNSLFR
jgi:hypothetical protein